MTKLMKQAKAFMRDEEGATAVEYGVLVALIIAVLVTVITSIGTTLNTKFNDVNTAIGGTSTATPPAGG